MAFSGRVDVLVQAVCWSYCHIASAQMLFCFPLCISDYKFTSSQQVIVLNLQLLGVNVSYSNFTNLYLASVLYFNGIANMAADCDVADPKGAHFFL